MDFLAECNERFKKLNSVLCLGLDPVLEKIPFKNKSDVKKTIYSFYHSLIENFKEFIYVVKPNIAFYEQYGIDGLKALKYIINFSKKLEIPVILDAKRGDIGETSKAYAKACFEELNADAITLSPYLGCDSLQPFFEYREKGFFILARTSNKGSSDFQLLKTSDNEFLYKKVTDKVINWNKTYSSNIGAVAGATHIDELNDIAEIFMKENGLPILIPGIGKQGGNFREITNILIKNNYPMHKIFINSSSGINYAYLNHPDMDYLEAASIEIKKLQLNKLNSL